MRSHFEPIEIGARFTRLVAIERQRPGNRRISCVCDCGATTEVRVAKLRDGVTRSCGCLHRDHMRARAGLPKHGMSRSTEYHIWQSMKQRCENPHNRAYGNYGGRGITVCERWQSFENFYADMGKRPRELSLDRRDNDGPYSPKNCRWATAQEQRQNQRPSNECRRGHPYVDGSFTVYRGARRCRHCMRIHAQEARTRRESSVAA